MVNQKVSGPRHSPKALVIIIFRLVVCCLGRVGSAAGATLCCRHTVLQSSSQQSNVAVQVLGSMSKKYKTQHKDGVLLVLISFNVLLAALHLSNYEKCNLHSALQSGVQ